jgi:hypothetical protein
MCRHRHQQPRRCVGALLCILIWLLQPYGCCTAVRSAGRVAGNAHCLLDAVRQNISQCTLASMFYLPSACLPGGAVYCDVPEIVCCVLSITLQPSIQTQASSKQGVSTLAVPLKPASLSP